jgi:NAD(P)-dependent dehydrogenase (short-subunit alcohol dehydrogenase family)
MSRTPMKRLGEPARSPTSTRFLLSSASSYMTGEIVYIDGGRLT